MSDEEQVVSPLPAQVRLSVPYGRFVEGEPQVVVRAQPGDDMVALQARYGRRLAWVELPEETLEDLAFLDTLGGLRLRVHTRSGPPLTSEPQVQLLRRTRPVFVVQPSADLLRTVNLVASGRFRVHIDASGSETADADGLRKATEFFLYNPVLVSPIEPLASLLAHLVRGMGHTLWETEIERPRDAFVDDRDRVTASRRWADREQFYGRFNDGWESLTASPLAVRVRGARKAMFRERSACALCAHLLLCRGYLRAVEPEADCSPWQGSFELLREAARKARELGTKLQ